MEDIMHIRSTFLRHIISMAVGQAIKKQGLKYTYVNLNDLRVSHKDNDLVKVHLDIDAEIHQSDLIKILYRAGVLGKEKENET
nr:MAG TPA: hypothetical protein [Caudoviricetes sp.]